jgi:hypothetical protein
VVLTADEYADLTQQRDTAFDEWTISMELCRERAAKNAALVRAGDVLATRLDESPWTTTPKRQAVREWLAVAHPNGEGHVEIEIHDATPMFDPNTPEGNPPSRDTTIGERGEVSGATWESATE